MIKTLLALLSLLVVVIVSVSFVSGLSLVVPEKLELFPGQEFDGFLDIQNLLDGASDLTMEGSFESGGEYASFEEDSSISVQGGTVTSIPVNFRIPEGAEIGDIYDVTVLFNTIEGGQGLGNVGFAQGLRRDFKLVVVPAVVEDVTPISATSTPQKSSTSEMVIWIVAVVVAFGISLWVLNRRSSGRKGN